MSTWEPPQQAGSSVPQRRVGKTRNPWGVWGLGLITFGIYLLYWYYTVNDETRQYERSIDVRPGLSLLALFVPIANIVSVVKSAGRIRRCQEVAGASERCSGVAGFFLLFLAATWVVYYQSQLNKVWDRYNNPEPGTVV